ncbi:unnamed protein product [Malus baccata var. baccata]
MATVSQSPSTRMIQAEIADEIGLKFDVESDSGRARKLYGRLMEIKRILIVFDDLWTELDFEAIGLPYGHAHQGCKILLTSRDSEVVNECGGLPIAIVTVGKALEKKRKHEWVDALKQLRRYFSNNVTLEESRNRVHSLVDKLQRRFLLLDSKVKEATKMHDIVRDVAISIASKDPHGFMITNHAEKIGWPNLATQHHYTMISLVGNLKIRIGLNCPKVELLQTMNGSLSEGSMDIICNTMKELKVLALVKMEGLDSSTLGVLKNLRTLCLDFSYVDGLPNDVIGGLENLEILSLRGCYSLRELPREIRRLKQLRLLDTTNCECLWVIPHGIFSSLCRLEELYMLNSFDRWELATGGEDKRMASISEVMSLSDHLKVLAIEIPNVIHLLPNDIVLKSRTIRFDIYMETHLSSRSIPYLVSCAFENKLDIGKSDARELMESQAVRLLLKESEDLRLESVIIRGCDQLEEIVSKQRRELEKAADMIAFHKLTNLELWSLDSFVGFFQANKPYSNQEVTTPKDEHQSEEIFDKAIFPSKCISWLQSLEEVKLGHMKHKDMLFDLKSHIVMDGQAVLPIFSQLHKLVIIHCSFIHLWKNIPSGFQGFQNLRYLEMIRCFDLEYVFLHLIAKKLLNLQEVKISKCPDIETIIRITEENEEEATNDMILFPKLNTFRLEGLSSLTSLCAEGFTFLWSSTKNMLVKKCHKLKTLGAVIPQRKKLEIKIQKDSTTHDFSTSPTRSSNWCPAACRCTPCLRANAHRCIEILPRPINLEVTPTNLEDSNDNDNLENLVVSDCASFELIFQVKGTSHEESSHSIEVFNKLRFLRLYKLPSLMRVWETGTSQLMITGGSFGNLKSLHVVWCDHLKYLFSSSIAKLLASIEDIEVEGCNRIEEIVAAEEETDEIITLPKLNSIKLESLPNLKYFCGEAYSLKLPSLALLRVNNVQNFRIFAPKLIDTHPLPQVYIMSDQLSEVDQQAEWMGDLNATVRNIYDTRKE